MRTTITIDDDLLERASAAIGKDKPSEVVSEALEALVQREAARRLIALGGSAPHAKLAPRRRSAPATPTRRARG
ncbi:MAG: type II toxin-antitoxin system VapB family antitoxin [Xanthomonadales bacterium]|nr:type II toxin-antitoxin system VapB family antitoxin [Xanthomonadales bacterium]